MSSSNVVPGRPRRQQQVYRRANTSLNLTGGGGGGGLDTVKMEDPYVGCSSIVDKFIGQHSAATASSSGYDSNTLPSGSVMNGGSVGSSRKSSSSGGAAFKDFVMGRANTSRDYPSNQSGGGGAMSDTTVTADALPISGGGGSSNNWAVQDQSVIDDLTIGPARQQPKYSYLVGRSNTSNDMWRKPATNTNYSHLNSYQPPTSQMFPPPPPVPPPSLPLQNSQSTAYMVPPPPSPATYNNTSYIPKRSSQLYDNYDFNSNNNMYSDMSYGNTSNLSSTTGNKRTINSSLGTDYQQLQQPSSRPNMSFNQPPPPLSTFSSNRNFISSNNNTSNNNSSASAALSYEERINTALGRKVPKSSTTSTITSTGVQKSKSYSNFDSVRREPLLQVQTHIM